MIKLHHAQYSRSLRVRWLMEELGIEYEIVPIDMSKGDHKTDEYRAINPFGLLPAFEDGDIKMFESGAILIYLMDKYGDGGLRPEPGTPESAEYLSWFFFGEATLQPFFSTFARHKIFLPKDRRLPQASDDAKEGALATLKVVDGFLEDRDYIAGDTFSAADIMTTYSLVLAHLFGVLPNDGLPNVEAYYERISARDAFKTTTAS